MKITFADKTSKDTSPILNIEYAKDLNTVIENLQTSSV